MDTGIITALISSGCTLLVCITTNAIQASSTRKLLEYRLAQLEAKVDKHNNLVERTFQLEKNVAVIQETIKSIEKEN